MAAILTLENLNYGYIDGGYKREILKNLSPSPAIDFREKNKVIARNAILFIIVKFYSVKASAWRMSA